MGELYDLAASVGRISLYLTVFASAVLSALEYWSIDDPEAKPWSAASMAIVLLGCAIVMWLASGNKNVRAGVGTWTVLDAVLSI